MRVLQPRSEINVTPFVAGALATLGCLLAWRASNRRVLLGGAVTLGCLATMPVFTGGGLTLQETFTRATEPGVPATRFAIVLAVGAALLLFFVRPRALLSRVVCLSRWPEVLRETGPDASRTIRSVCR